MPLSRYNKHFGGKRGSAAKAKRAMAGQYGEKKGEEVFYATMAKHMKKMHSKMPEGASMSPKGDLGAHRQAESKKAGGFKGGSEVSAAKALPYRECKKAKGVS